VQRLCASRSNDHLVRADRDSSASKPFGNHFAQRVIAIRSVVPQRDIRFRAECRIERAFEGGLWHAVSRRQSGREINQVRVAGLAHKIQQASPRGEFVRQDHQLKVLSGNGNLQGCLEASGWKLVARLEAGERRTVNAER
jgi:hypothetical protein